MIFFSSLSLKKNQDRIKRRKCNIRGIIWEDLSLFPDIIFTRCWLQRTFISGRELNTNSFPLRTCPHVSHYFFIPFFLFLANTNKELSFVNFDVFLLKKIYIYTYNNFQIILDFFGIIILNNYLKNFLTILKTRINEILKKYGYWYSSFFFFFRDILL